MTSTEPPGTPGAQTSECAYCAALEQAPVSASPHAYLLLHSEASINLGGTGTGHVEYYICTICNTRWERARVWSEPRNTWKHAAKPLA